ncbi:MAG: two-component system, cell cycle sensor histidine kinase and response regulator CckA [Gaiellales bacterium]|nr:two-component system, cell cycle sensor histidine kinase and response regulator CckA [Gaiellales bacterium]
MTDVTDSSVAVLLVDDDEEDALLTQDLLVQIDGTRYRSDWVGRYSDALAAVAQTSYDVCLVDYRLGPEDGIALVRELVANGFDTPIIVLTGLGDRAVDIQATSAGAADYLVKGEVTPALLERSIRYSMRRHADMRALRESEEGLRQGQRMEAVGRFAGGVAHDFNNMMSAVVGFSALVLDALESENPLRRYVEEIQRAGERASDMTKQLLAFTRKQVLLPQVLDLNEVVIDVNGLLARLIGEDVELRSDLSPRVHPVEADVGQLEQVIVNLAVNARDAMPAGGTLTIATANREISETDAIARDLEAGSYVALSVTDTGEGMDETTLRQIFEPFFTTKEEGKGTGLGLATAFGIVKQSGGHIEVESEPGRGTTFTICLPRVKSTLLALAPAEAPAPAPGSGSETILLVEDEEVVRILEREVLERHGYTVLEADGPEHATELAHSHPGVIHLLLTDVVMPGMSGDKLAEQLLAARPEMKVIFASGYAADMIAQRGLLAPGTAFLPKPLTPASITGKVREVLDAVALRRAS